VREGKNNFAGQGKKLGPRHPTSVAKWCMRFTVMRLGKGGKGKRAKKNGITRCARRSVTDARFRQLKKKTQYDLTLGKQAGGI